MRKLKNYFKLIMTAVICFFVSVVSDKKMSRKVKELLVNGQVVLGQNSGFSGTKDSVEYIWNNNLFKSNMAILENESRYSMYQSISGQNFIDQRNQFLWRQGPGDPEHVPKRYVLRYKN